LWQWLPKSILIGWHGMLARPVAKVSRDPPQGEEQNEVNLS
jgi:hypothetical protein